MFKRIVAGLLCALLALSLAAPVFAAETVSQSDKALVLAALEIMEGDENGDLHLEKPVTRAEFTKLILAASPAKKAVGDSVATDPYPDVPHTHWAAPWVQAAVTAGYVKGNLQGYFQPARTITLAEGATMALSVLGYSEADFQGGWPDGQMALYRSLDLNRDMTVTSSGATLTRSDALCLLYNLLTAKTKSGTPYLTMFGYPLTPAGDVDRVALLNAKMEGPVLASAVPITPKTVYRDGVPADFAALQADDMVYWSKPCRTVWAYSEKVSGTLEQLTPSAAAPTAAVVGGHSYPIETAAATLALSDLGQFRIGDRITLHLGRNGGVAAVRTASESEGLLYGVVSGVAPAPYTDAGGKSYSALTVYLTGTDGKAYSYRWSANKDDAPKAGDLVQVSGGTQVEKLSAQPLTGKVSADGTKIGTTLLADNVQILDTYEDKTAATVYPKRLAGVTFKGDMVRFYVTNADGQLTHLILNDVTGDLHRYGVLTDVSEIPMGMMLSATYVYELGGIPQPPYASQTAIWNLKEGPCQVKSDGGAVRRISNLTSLPLDSVSSATALRGANRYTVSDQVAVYELRDKTYYLTDLARIQTGYTLTGYCDKAESEGGRIRVIVAKAA